jgi:hypothetical protein
MRRLTLVPLFLVIVLGMVTPRVHAMEIKYAFAFTDRFPDEAAPLGFTPGNLVQVGAMVKAGDFTITEATATNLDTGLVLNLVQRNIGAIYTNLLFNNWPFPPLDPYKHKGVWEIRVRDEKGNEAVVKSHRLDKIGELPYVENIKASGSPFAPTITWTALKEGDYPPECKIKYRVRLLKNNGNQFYKTKKLSSETKDEIPRGILKYEDIPDTYIRIETQCWDSESDHPVAVETKSETFRPLVEAFSQ